MYVPTHIHTYTNHTCTYQTHLHTCTYYINKNTFFQTTDNYQVKSTNSISMNYSSQRGG